WGSGARRPSACGLCARPSPRPWSPRRYARSSRTSCVALDAIRDQPRAVALLRRALASDRVAHAYAFVGPTGAGRMTTALAFAEELLESPSRQHPDMHVIVPTPPESNPRGARAIRIGAIRELERQASLRPAMGRRKVFVLVRAQGVEALFRRTDHLEREKAEALVDAYWLFCRDLLLAKSGAPGALLVDAGRAAELAREAEGWTIDQILSAVDGCRQAREALLRNVAPRLTLEIVLSRLALRAA